MQKAQGESEREREYTVDDVLARIRQKNANLVLQNSEKWMVSSFASNTVSEMSFFLRGSFLSLRCYVHHLAHFCLESVLSLVCLFLLSCSLQIIHTRGTFEMCQDPIGSPGDAEARCR